LAGVDFGNIIFDINGNELTIKNPTIFTVRPTLASTLSAPTNDNDIVTKKYVDFLIPDLSIYLTINDVYIKPQTGPIDLTVVEVVDPEGHKLITKKYLDSVVPDSSTFLTINDTASIANSGHYVIGYDVYNWDDHTDSVYYPLSGSGIQSDNYKLVTKAYVDSLFNSLQNS
jgi:hypothetical protein